MKTRKRKRTRAKKPKPKGGILIIVLPPPNKAQRDRMHGPFAKDVDRIIAQKRGKR